MAREKLDVMKTILAMGNVGYPALFGGGGSYIPPFIEKHVLVIKYLELL